MSRPEPTIQYPNIYNVKVTVTYDFEVEADNEAMAEELGWYWEDFAMYAETDSITVDLQTEYCQTCGEDIEGSHCEEEETE
jgi:hypothetical protein